MLKMEAHCALPCPSCIQSIPVSYLSNHICLSLLSAIRGHSYTSDGVIRICAKRERIETPGTFTFNNHSLMTLYYKANILQYCVHKLNIKVTYVCHP